MYVIFVGAHWKARNFLEYTHHVFVVHKLNINIKFSIMEVSNWIMIIRFFRMTELDEYLPVFDMSTLEGSLYIWREHEDSEDVINIRNHFDQVKVSVDIVERNMTGYIPLPMQHMLAKVQRKVSLCRSWMFIWNWNHSIQVWQVVKTIRFQIQYDDGSSKMLWHQYKSQMWGMQPSLRKSIC